MPSTDQNRIPSELKKIDHLIRNGDGASAQQELELLLKQKLPRSYLTEAAALAWRCNLPLVGIRLLNPIVRPSHRKPNEATDIERIEYAACLVKLGATEEAIKLLQVVSKFSSPRQFLIEAFAYIAQWKYKEAIPLLTKYLKAPGVKNYDKIVGRVNLAEALIHERHDQKALVVLRELLHDSGLQKLILVQGKVLELSAQYWIGRRKFTEASTYLEKAERLLQNSKSLDAFFVKKWKALMEFAAHSAKNGTPALVNSVKEEAARRSHWETIRDCDRVEALVRKDEGLIRKLYFGTPFETFRTQLQADWGKAINGENGFLWQLGPVPVLKPAINLTAVHESMISDLKPGQLLHRLLSTLCTDFYRPFRLAALHSQLYPGEFFNPNSSPSRIHEAVKRLRSWISDHKLSLQIIESAGTYRLESSVPFSIQVPLPSVQRSRGTTFLQLVRSHWPDSGFTVTELSKVLDCSTRTALNYVKEAQEEGAVVREGRGPSTKYRLAG